MQWKELKSDIQLSSLTEAFGGFDCLSALYVMSNLVHGVRVYAVTACTDAVLSHVRSGRKEVGGLLLGRVYQGSGQGHNSTDMLIHLTKAVPSIDYFSSAVSLEMGTEVWCRVNEDISEGNIVVGWYHSHPNLGAFFSGTDRRTQRAFFNHHYSLGWVIDPFRDEQKVYCGAESQEYHHPILMLDQNLDMVQNH